MSWSCSGRLSRLGHEQHVAVDDRVHPRLGQQLGDQRVADVGADELRPREVGGRRAHVQPRDVLHLGRSLEATCELGPPETGDAGDEDPAAHQPERAVPDRASTRTCGGLAAEEPLGGRSGRLAARALRLRCGRCAWPWTAVARFGFEVERLAAVVRFACGRALRGVERFAAASASLRSALRLRGARPGRALRFVAADFVDPRFGVTPSCSSSCVSSCATRSARRSVAVRRSWRASRTRFGGSTAGRCPASRTPRPARAALCSAMPHHVVHELLCALAGDLRRPERALDRALDRSPDRVRARARGLPLLEPREGHLPLRDDRGWLAGHALADDVAAQGADVAAELLEPHLHPAELVGELRARAAPPRTASRAGRRSCRPRPRPLPAAARSCAGGARASPARRPTAG